MKYKLTNIEYDTDDSLWGEENNIKLPTTAEVECENEDRIADAISDLTGWLVKSFVIESTQSSI